MTETAFLVLPLEAPAAIDASASRADSLVKLAQGSAGLDAELRGRLPDFDVEYLAGLGGWTVRTAHDLPTAALRDRLHGLDVEVAEDSEFSAL